MGIVIGHGRRIVIRLPDAPVEQRERALPLDARLAMFVLEAEAADADEAPRPRYQRRDERLACRFHAALLYAKADALAAAPPETLRAALLTESAGVYIRDISPGHAGFVSRQPLPAGSGQICWLRLDQADGSTVTLRGQIDRCRSFMDGWHEGVIRFELLADENTEPADEPELRIAV